ncbi:MAG: hypothetical protein M3N09_02420 [Actinomycetota bacterium]|nr:hypothetical protein [Actinomycetota bacterium]
MAYRNDPEVARYQSWESCSELEALDFIRELRSSEPGTPGEWFQFAVELKGSGPQKTLEGRRTAQPLARVAFETFIPTQRPYLEEHVHRLNRENWSPFLLHGATKNRTSGGGGPSPTGSQRNPVLNYGRAGTSNS